MQERLSKDWRPRNVNQLAHHLVILSTQADSKISRVMATMGRRGENRREASAGYDDSEQRREIALKAARKRWDNAKKSI